MKPPEGMYQTATKVKVLSPENTNIEEADSFHKLEGRINHTVMARYSLLFRGLRPWYGAERKLLEPGRPALFPQRWIPANIGILAEGFTVENKLMNPTYKVIRPKVEEHYKELFDYLYTPESKTAINPRNVEAMKQLLNG